MWLRVPESVQRWIHRRHRRLLKHELVELGLVATGTALSLSLFLIPSNGLELGMAYIEGTLLKDSRGISFQAGMFGGRADEYITEVWIDGVLARDAGLRRAAVVMLALLIFIGSALTVHHSHCLHLEHGIRPHNRLGPHALAVMIAVIVLAVQIRNFTVVASADVPEGYIPGSTGYAPAVCVESASSN